MPTTTILQPGEVSNVALGCAHVLWPAGGDRTSSTPYSDGGARRRDVQFVVCFGKKVSRMFTRIDRFAAAVPHVTFHS